MIHAEAALGRQERALLLSLHESGDTDGCVAAQRIQIGA